MVGSGRVLMTPPLSPCPYSRECVQGVFSEVQMRHPVLHGFSKEEKCSQLPVRTEIRSQRVGGVHKDSLCWIPLLWGGPLLGSLIPLLGD